MVMYGPDDGADGNIWHWTAMAVAAYYKQLEVMRWLIEKGAKVDEDRELHELPSNAAASVGFIEGLELLKYKGCDLSKANSEGTSPVHCAAVVGNMPTLRLLKGWGVPMDVNNCFGRTPAYYTAEKGHTECSQFLNSAKSGVRK
jgi:ankyrin repeat protein